jgi:CheY-like chemotaxis protein
MARNPNDIQILIVDDDELLLETYSSLFEQFKFNVTTALNGEIGWQILQEKKVDLVISDIRMPKMDGIELLTKIRLQLGNDICVLLTSGYSNYAIDMIYDLGADGFLDKPTTLTVIREAMRRALIKPKLRWVTSNADKGFSGITLKTHIKLETLESLMNSSKIRVGRGGFFWATDKVVPTPKSELKFTIEFNDNTLPVEGLGIVRWSRSIAESDKVSAYGLEIVSLTDSCLATYSDWLESKALIPFIPACGN